jgi:Domain of unknown function (DUF4440)
MVRSQILLTAGTEASYWLAAKGVNVKTYIEKCMIADRRTVRMIHMKDGIRLVVFLLVTAAGVAALECPGGQAKDEATLVGLEQTWAKALEAHDTATVKCLLAEEFQDVGVDGTVYDRATALGRIASRRPSENHLEDVHAHIHGEMAYVRGLNRVTDSAGAVLARVRFTDIFVYREGRWLAVAGQETLVEEKR